MTRCVREGCSDIAILKSEAAAFEGDVVGYVVALVVGTAHVPLPGDVGIIATAGEACGLNLISV